MIKDPLNNTPTPYEILDVLPNSDRNTVHQALPKFMRDRERMAKYGMGIAQEARRKLTDPKDRIGIDIFFYSINDASSDIDHKPLDVDIQEFLSVPLLKEGEIYTDLDKTDFMDEYEEIQFNKIKLSELNKYDDRSYEFEIVFDK